MEPIFCFLITMKFISREDNPWGNRDIFCDFYLQYILVFQGTILDRIDYNVEHASVQVEKGLQQLQKAEKYQKKNRKMLCIVILAVIIILLMIILIAVKS